MRCMARGQIDGDGVRSMLGRIVSGPITLRAGPEAFPACAGADARPDAMEAYSRRSPPPGRRGQAPPPKRVRRRTSLSVVGGCKLQGPWRVRANTRADGVPWRRRDHERGDSRDCGRARQPSRVLGVSAISLRPAEIAVSSEMSPISRMSLLPEQHLIRKPLIHWSLSYISGR